MARFYTLREAVQIIAEGKDLEAIADIGRRYPVLLQKIAVVVTKGGNEFVDLMNFIPDYITANKINMAIKASIEGVAVKDADSKETKAKAKKEDKGTVPKAKIKAKKVKAENADDDWDI